MVIELEGGCRVTDMREGSPEDSGNRRIWRHFESVLSLRVVELTGPTTFANDSHDEVLYDLAKNEGIYIPAGASLTLDDPATYISSLTPATPSGRRTELLRLSDHQIQPTGDRWYARLGPAARTKLARPV